jgi:hypothetical protein
MAQQDKRHVTERAPLPVVISEPRRIKASGCGFLAIVARGDELLVWARCRRRGQARREGGDVGNRGAGSTYAWIALVLGLGASRCKWYSE